MLLSIVYTYSMSPVAEQKQKNAGSIHRDPSLIMPILPEFLQMKSDSSDFWETFRRQMPVAQRWTYLDHAAVAPLSGPAQAAIVHWASQATEQGDVCWPQWEQQANQVREAFALLMGADATEIALVPNTTTGIGLVAEGFPWRTGDNIVTLANEFPSNQYPWMNLADRGVQTRRVTVDEGQVHPDHLLSACDERTRMISVSWVGYATGWRIDVPKLVQEAHQRGIFVFLDAIQGLGVFPLDAHQWGVDFLAADGHKWMLGPEGAGVLFVRAEHLDRLRPLMVGWNSVKQAHNFSHCHWDPRTSAARYEGGSANMVGYAGLGASLKLLASLGLTPNASPLADRVLQLTDWAVERLQAIGAEIRSPLVPGHRSGILAFELPGADPAEIRRRCLDEGVVLSVRHGWIRISPHGYNSQQDIDRLAEVLQRV
jgi:cysteine desulfurase / selenocysteine lyase